MRLIVAAIGATAAGLLELTVVPYMRVGEAQPHPVLVFGVVWVLIAGFESGLVWAFVGGLVLDILAARPLGTSALALLVALGGASAAGHLLARVRPLAPVPLTFAFSLVYSSIVFVLLSALATPLPIEALASALLPGAFYDTILAAIVGPLAVSIHDRSIDQDRADW